MAHRTPARRPATRHHPDVLYLHQLEALAKRDTHQTEFVRRYPNDQVLYARWLARQAQIAEQDRKMRRSMAIFAAILGTVLLAIAGLFAWLCSQAIASVSNLDADLLLGGLFVLLVLAGLIVGGHRCVTVIKHWH